MGKLRLQLIAVLVLTALLPLVPAAWVAHSLFRLSLDPLLETSIVEGARAGLASTRDLLDGAKRDLVADLEAGVARDTLTAAELAALDPRERSALGAWSRLADAAAPSSGLPTGVRVLIPPERLPLGGREQLVAYVQGTADGEPVWIVAPIPAALGERAGRLSDSIRLVQTLRRERGAVTRSLLATFLVVYGVTLVAVLVLGLWLASRLTRPLAALGRGIESVAAGDLATRVPAAGGGAVGRLLAEFNRMVERLHDQRAEVVRLERLAAWRQMARRLAHEIKNPLTPIRLAAQELRDRLGEAVGGAPASERQLVRESTRIIEEEVRGLHELVAEFSQFARLPEPRMGAVAVPELLAEIGGLYGAERVTLRAADVPPLVNGDRDQLHRVLVNLVGNALAAQQQTGVRQPVVVAASAAAAAGERQLRIEVIDRGPGVPVAERRRIFEPDVTTKPGGMGLGLAIVQGSVEAHGGTVAVTERAGGGAVFTVTLPLRAPGAEREADRDDEGHDHGEEP